MDALSLGVLLADSDDTRLQALSRMINQLGHRVVAVATGGGLAVALARDAKPDVAVVGPFLDDMSGPAAAGMLSRNCPLPIVLLMDDGDAHQPEDLAVFGVRAWVPLAPDLAILRAGLAAAHQGFERADQLQREVSELSLALEERKLVERAKGLLMERFGLIEETACAKLADRALTDGSSLAEAARAVVEDLTVHNPRPRRGAQA